MLHKPAAPAGKDPSAPYKMQLGVWMFIAYALFYGGFVLINLVAPKLMERTVLAGLNLATVYGFTLIIVALIQAIVYDWLCHRKETQMEAQQDDKKGQS